MQIPEFLSRANASKLERGGVGGTNRESLLQCHVARGRVSSVYEFVKIGRGSQAQLVTILLLSSCIHIVYLRSNYI